MQDDERLFQFLEDSIYSIHPESYWWGTWMKDVNSGHYDFINDELTGIKAYTEFKVDSSPYFGNDTNGFSQEFCRIANIPHTDGETTEREVEVQFIIEKTGKLIGPRIKDKESEQLNEEERQVIETISKIQNWTPGIYEGEPVDVFLTRYLSY